MRRTKWHQNYPIWTLLWVIKRRFLEHSVLVLNAWMRVSSWIYKVRLMHGKVFKSHFKAKIEYQKIQILARSSHTPILRVFFEFSNLSKTPQRIFFRSNLNDGRCISKQRTVLAWFRKNLRNFDFWPIFTRGTSGTN